MDWMDVEPDVNKLEATNADICDIDLICLAKVDAKICLRCWNDMLDMDSCLVVKDVVDRFPFLLELLL